MCAALTGSDADALCCYDQRLDGALLAAAEHAHPVVLRGCPRREIRTSLDESPVTEIAEGRLRAPPDRVSVLTFRGDQAAVRGFTADHARHAGLSASRVTDLVIAVAELAANTLQHTSTAGVLTIWTDAGEIICQVSDKGEITDPLAGTLRPDPADLGSRGLWLVHQVSDLVQIRSGPAGNTIRVHMRLREPESGASDHDG